MTSSAKDFITPLTLSTLSKNPVLTEFIKDETGQWNNHVDLGLWADAMFIAPASANTLGKMANGLCDNLLLAVYLSARCPVFIGSGHGSWTCWHMPPRKTNLKRISSFGNHVIDPTYTASWLVVWYRYRPDGRAGGN
jgi:phosphopantothenoylcysteine decarboxylase/phosphopantothenate--cysteine ligase